MSQEMNSYIYILEEKKGASRDIISFEPTLFAARKMLSKLANRAKETLEADEVNVYTTKSSNKNSITLFRTSTGYLYNSALIPEITISIKRVPNHPDDQLPP